MLYFYPKDDTPGCHIEANHFTALADDFFALDTVVIGVSKDDCSSHHAFIEKFKIKVMLLADTSGELCESYGVWQLKKFMGKENMGVVRTSFLIDEHGKLEHIFNKFKTKDHHEVVLNYLKSKN